jgi:hypothetical protein
MLRAAVSPFSRETTPLRAVYVPAPPEPITEPRLEVVYLKIPKVHAITLSPITARMASSGVRTIKTGPGHSAINST